MNDCLLNVLNFNPNISNAILEFKEKKIGFTVDIENWKILDTWEF